MYLTKETIAATLRQLRSRGGLRTGGPRTSDRRGAGNGTPFISFFTPGEMLALAREAGFREARHVPASALAERYFAGRADGLCPPDKAEELLVATT